MTNLERLWDELFKAILIWILRHHHGERHRLRFVSAELVQVPEVRE